METTLPGPEAIERLVAYLPRLYASGFEPVERWDGGTQDEHGVWQMPYPIYHPLVTEFFRLVSEDGWLDYAYDPPEASRMLAAEGLVEHASLAQVKTMLTFCARGERFADGHWAEMIEGGHVGRLLARLKDLLAEAQARPSATDENRTT